MRILDHENIIKFHESFETYDYMIYVIELVRGCDLFKFVTDQDYLEEREASFILKKVLSALSYIHMVGLVHRDLKPENIMVIADESNKNKALDIKIIDFGFAAYLEELTDKSTACGTLNYVAPEVYHTQKYQFVTDVFSVGVILYFMVRGELPFNSEVPDILVANICAGTYNMDNDDHFLNISDQCKDLIQKMLVVDPNQRITVIEALAHPFVSSPDQLPAIGTHKNAQNGFNFDIIGQNVY